MLRPLSSVTVLLETGIAKLGVTTLAADQQRSVPTS